MATQPTARRRRSAAPSLAAKAPTAISGLALRRSSKDLDRGRTRSPQVFVELSRELEAQGLNQKVSADMFGMALRSYQRKVQRLGESSTVCGRSLWEAVYDFVRSGI